MENKNNKIILANPTSKISIFKKFKMKLNIKMENFKLWKARNKHIEYYKEFMADLIPYSICGILIFLPIFYFNVFSMGLAFGAGLFIYSKKLHLLFIQVLSSISLIKGDKK